MIFNSSICKCLTNHWREIVEAAGSTISQIKHLNQNLKIGI